MKRFILSMLVPVCAFIFLVVLSFFCISVYKSEVQKQAIHTMEVLDDYISKAKANGESIDSRTFITRLSEIADCRVCLFSGEGNLLIDSDTTGSKDPDPYSAVNTTETKNGVISDSISYQDNQHFLNEFSYFKSDNANSFIICASFPLSRFNNLLLIQKSIILGGCILLITAVLFYGLWQKALSSKTIGITKSNNGLINKIKKIELYANERISLLSTVLANMESGIILFGTDCSILMMNPKAQSLTGAKSSLFFPHRPNPELEYPPVLIAILKMVRNSMSSKKTLIQDLHTDDGKILSIHIDIVYSKYIPYTFYGTQAFITDVTEKRRMEKIKDEFVSNVSHELRTPLTLISGFAETLQDWRELDDKDCERALEIIDIESKRLKHMISQLLDLSHIESRIGANNLVPIDPIETIRSIISTIQALSEKRNINFKIELASEKAEILGDKVSIVQIVSNLCENAIKYTPSGGNVLLSVQKEKNHLVILVKDNGIGIPESEIPHIFERFYRVEKSRNTKRGGSGLGLSIVKGLVDELGGDISVKSRLHYGSTFTVHLPLLCKEVTEGKTK